MNNWDNPYDFDLNEKRTWAMMDIVAERRGTILTDLKRIGNTEHALKSQR